ncbi:hypothetical protein [Chondromyces crocatus]|uniref:Uncharacterized protein n=1 Tax=Chondromyces crocatus TaxID=52 RepID=A0A0K1EE58_CHOCO|nr:hypothetical protein [Chondromyces crocatus]AKT39129.1 uncharacterized protein CMC5_032760 [Chondromyces crocatus]
MAFEPCDDLLDLVVTDGTITDNLIDVLELHTAPVAIAGQEFGDDLVDESAHALAPAQT